MGFEVIGQLSDGFRGDAHVVVQAEKILALGGAQSDVEGFG